MKLFEPDYHQLKVICQKCDKVGTINTSKFQDAESPFFRRLPSGFRGSEFGDPVVAHYLCADCLGVTPRSCEPTAKKIDIIRTGYKNKEGAKE